MRSSLGDKNRLEHIMECIMEIETDLKAQTFDTFVENHVLRIAIVKWLEIIGEAANHVTSDAKIKYANVEWSKMIALRNIVVHEYFGISYEVIWNVAIIDIKRLKSEVEGIITLL